MPPCALRRLRWPSRAARAALAGSTLDSTTSLAPERSSLPPQSTRSTSRIPAFPAPVRCARSRQSSVLLLPKARMIERCVDRTFQFSPVMSVDTHCGASNACVTCFCVITGLAACGTRAGLFFRISTQRLRYPDPVPLRLVSWSS